MKQRASRHIDTSSGAERVAACDVACRHGEVGVSERHALGPTSTAARVKHERHVVHGRRRNGSATERSGRAGQGHGACGVHVATKIGTRSPAARRASSAPSGGRISTRASVSSR